MLLAILLVASLRFIGLDRFATVDEPAWLLNSANFYYALGQRDFEKTVAEYQPAVTGMWITTAALLDYFPEYRGQGQGYFTKIADFNQFLAAHGKQPLELLKRSRAITLIVNTILLVAAFFLLKYLVGAGAAFIAALLIGLDPYFTGHARLLNHEALMCLFLLVSVLAILVYLEVQPRLVFLLISAVAAGLALLTKSSATLILPFVGLVIGIKAFEQWRQDRLLRKALVGALKTLLIWLAGLILTYFLVWPGMWVNPARMLYEVYGNALSYAFQGQGLALTQELNPQEFALEFGGTATYLNALLWATTPLIWLGALLSGAALFMRDRQIVNTLTKKVIVYFALLAVAFILQFGLALGRNSAHYILASYMCLDILAGIGLIAALRWLGKRFSFLGKKTVQAGILTVLLLIQAASLFSQFPYYYTYANPLTAWIRKGSGNPNVGYGEGLNLAGEYLSQKPDAGHLTAMSWYGIGPFSYFFEGKTDPLLVSQRLDGKTIDSLKAADYLVIYYINQKRRNLPQDLLSALEGFTPEQVILLNGLEYIRIYKLADLPDDFYTLLKR